jgi:hypothetical protein
MVAGWWVAAILLIIVVVQMVAYKQAVKGAVKATSC